MTPAIASTAERLSAGSTGRDRKAVLARRRRSIRRRIAAWVTGLFVAVWLFIAFQLVLGHDPALARTSSQHKTTSSLAASSASPTSTSTSGSGASSSGASSSNNGTSSVTTRQS